MVIYKAFVTVFVLALVTVAVFSCTHTSSALFRLDDDGLIRDLEWEGDFLGCAAEKTVYVWSSGDSAPLVLTALSRPVIALDPRGDYLVACGSDGKPALLLLDLKNRLGEVSRLPCEKSVEAAAWSRDGELLAVITANGVSIHERVGLRSRLTAPHRLKSGECAWLPGRPVLVLHDREHLVLCDLGLDPPAITEVSIEGRKDAVAASPCGRFLAILDNRQELVRVLDVDRLAVIRAIPAEYGMQIVWSPDGKQLAVVSFDIDVYDIETGEKSTWIWPSRFVSHAAFGEGGSYLAAAGTGCLEVWPYPGTAVVPWLIGVGHANKLWSGLACAVALALVRRLRLSSRSRRDPRKQLQLDEIEGVQAQVIQPAGSHGVRTDA
jgi:WD40 repeat protein